MVFKDTSIKNWEPGKGLKIQTIEMHTGGEPLRVLTGGLPEIKGKTILEKRRHFREHFDHIRTGIMWEPRGHADMYGAIMTEPVTPDGDFGVFFMHNEGYSTMCGHGIIALTKMILDMGIIRREGEEVTLRIDGPPGRIISTAYRKRGEVERVIFRNVPSFVSIRQGEININDRSIRFDLAYGGAFYAFVEADDLQLALDTRHANQLIRTGNMIKHIVSENHEIKHPFEKDLGFLYGTIFTGIAQDPGHHSRNVCIFADGELDRSATGSGVSARAAIHFDREELEPGKWITVESILGTTMQVRVAAVTAYGPYRAVVPEVSGTAHFTGRSEYWFHPDDPLKKGFIIR
jgi:trans-L-3-hydroxyproline dehydratase